MMSYNFSIDKSNVCFFFIFTVVCLEQTTVLFHGTNVNKYAILNSLNTLYAHSTFHSTLQMSLLNVMQKSAFFREHKLAHCQNDKKKPHYCS